MKILGIDMGGTNLRAGLLQDGRLTKIEAITLPASNTVTLTARPPEMNFEV